MRFDLFRAELTPKQVDDFVTIIVREFTLLYQRTFIVVRRLCPNGVALSETREVLYKVILGAICNIPIIQALNLIQSYRISRAGTTSAPLIPFFTR